MHPDIHGDRSFSAGHSATYDQVHLAIIRLDSKMDTLIQTQRVRDDALKAELIRTRDDFSRESVDHEARLRKLEERKYVEPKTIWSALALFITIGSLVVAIINLAIK